MKSIIIFLLIILLSGYIYGEMPYAFLDYSIGNSDLNRTGLASAGSGAASFYNPALLVNNGNQILFGYSQPFSENFFVKDGETGIDGIGVYSYGLSYSREKYGIGMSGLMMRNNDIQGYDEHGNETGLFSTYEGAVSFGYGMKLNDRMNVGIHNKVIFQRLYEGYNRFIGTIGFGIQRKLTSRLNISGVVDHLINYKISTLNIGYESPDRNYGLGLDYMLGRLNLSAALWSDFEDFMICTGVNVQLLSWLEVFGGVRDGLGYREKSFNALDGYSLLNSGLRFNVGSWSTDYSMGYQGILGIKHTVSGSYRY